jgi:hypothetical protein
VLLLGACGDDAAPATPAPDAPSGAASSSPAPPSTDAGEPAQTTVATAATSTTTHAVPEDPLAEGFAGDCAAGDDVACDLAFVVAAPGSGAGTTAETCGGRGLPEEGGWCSGHDFATSEAFAYGDDPFLDGLWNLCADGTGEACEYLYDESPLGSQYEDFAWEAVHGDDEPAAIDFDIALPAADPSTVADCAGLIDLAVAAFQTFIDAVDALSAEEQGALTGDEAAFGTLEGFGTVLEERSDAIGCSDEELQALFADRIGTLTASGWFGEMLIESLRTDGLDLGGP